MPEKELKKIKQDISKLRKKAPHDKTITELERRIQKIQKGDTVPRPRRKISEKERVKELRKAIEDLKARMRMLERKKTSVQRKHAKKKIVKKQVTKKKLVKKRVTKKKATKQKVIVEKKPLLSKLERELLYINQQLEELNSMQFPKVRLITRTHWSQTDEKEIKQEFAELENVSAHLPEMQLKRHRMTQDEKKAVKEVKKIERKLEGKRLRPRNKLLQVEKELDNLDKDY